MTAPLDLSPGCEVPGRNRPGGRLAQRQARRGRVIAESGELYEGIYFGKDPARDERALHGFLRFVEVLPLSRSIMKRFARIRGELRRQGQIIGDPDILIAATALDYDLVVVTRNTRHFARVAGGNIYQQ